MVIDLPLVWGLIIGLAIFLYVVLDGFDLGVGILFPFIKGTKHRNQMMSSVAPVWDGNETWLVLGGAGLFAVFPLAYSVLFTALYAPLIAMLLSLVFRGVAFEFRHRDTSRRKIWDKAFAGGSLAAAFFQGVVLGAFLNGTAIEERGYAGGWFDWLSPFSIFIGLALVAGYALLGSCWLIMKTEGGLQEKAYHLAWRLTFAVLAAIAVVSLWTPLMDPAIAARWFSFPEILYLSPVPLLVVAAAFGLLRALKKKNENQPFFLSQGLFTLSYIGLGISIFPNIIPPHTTIYEAAAPTESLEFMLIGAVIFLPFVMGYSAYTYWIFRGKVKKDDGHLY